MRTAPSTASSPGQPRIASDHLVPTASMRATATPPTPPSTLPATVTSRANRARHAFLLDTGTGRAGRVKPPRGASSAAPLPSPRRPPGAIGVRETTAASPDIASGRAGWGSSAWCPCSPAGWSDGITGDVCRRGAAARCAARHSAAMIPTAARRPSAPRIRTAASADERSRPNQRRASTRSASRRSRSAGDVGSPVMAPSLPCALYPVTGRRSGNGRCS